MKIKKVTRYYCDFCSTGKFRIDTITHHESRCTNNPNRHCGMCAQKRDYPELVREFLESYPNITKKDAIYYLESDVDCPACMLAVLRQSGKASDFTEEFHFKERMEQWNEDRRELDFQSQLQDCG